MTYPMKFAMAVKQKAADDHLYSSGIAAIMPVQTLELLATCYQENWM